MTTFTHDRSGFEPASVTAEAPSHLHHLARDLGARALTAVGLLGIGLIHVLDSVGKYSETRYLFWMYMGLTLGCLVLAGAVVHSRARVVWLAAAGLAASAFAGYVVNRTVGLPNAKGDIGNWTEPIGLAALFVEGAVVLVALYGLALSGRSR